ncbi:16S rRNA (guanine(966)-N(2))-methyltransferase RsmD [Xylocopilactobacillus apicola]|uniref:rRNA methyltransferase n=1 Tax=Xylocopilactobacillus apicola TaxID=2932184 RepID=A0AAU9DES8_9LACO|nr:16S rRNA (guanine(966)-N(2))-methyltransferase RsmD [Xylocopilactobacillus apicola]BDR59387.1 rRNA methyltransferase [Xylocopilactobacillus apicola]
MLRIIGGDYSGIKLVAPKGDNTRPTTDAVREAIFNLLQTYTFVGPVLDLYAGSGALGIEAFSRYEQPTYLVDRSYEAVQAVKANLVKLHHDEMFHVIKSDAKKALLKFQNQDLQFSLIFLDPPYRYQNQNDDVVQIVELGLTKPGTVFVSQGDLDLTENNFASVELLKFKKYGKTLIYIYRVRD